MENESYSKRASTVLVVSMLLLASFTLLVALSPAALAAVTDGATDNYVPGGTVYIRDDSTAIPIFAFGASSNTGTDWLNSVYVEFYDDRWWRTDLKDLDDDGDLSGVAVVRDDGDLDDVFDVNDTVLDATAVPSWVQVWWDRWECRINLQDPVPQNPAAGDDYNWFVVIRTSETTSNGDYIRARIEANDISFTTNSQPSGNVYANRLYVRETEYRDWGDGLMAANDAQEVLGLDICDGGPYEKFDYLRIEFASISGFTMSDLATVTTRGATSGVALYRNDGDSVWDAGDSPIDCTSVRVVGNNVYLYPDDEDLPNTPDTVDPEYWVIVRTSGTVSHNNRFRVYGDGYSISVNGTLDVAGDRQQLTPDWGNYDYEDITVDTMAPSYYGYSWSESSSYLHWDGSTFWFSGNMVWPTSARLTASVGDSPAGVYYVEFSAEPGLGIGSYRDYSSSYYRDIAFDATMSDASAPITLTLMDRVGNYRTVDIAYGKDTTPPSVTILAPTDTDTLSGVVTVRATASDAQAGVQYTSAVLYVNGVWTGMMPWDGTHFTYDWDTTTYTDGEYRLTVQVYDNVYNLGSERVNVYTDNTGPATTIIYPANAMYVNADANLTVYALISDFSPVTSAEAQLDGGGWTAMAYDSVNGTWSLNLGMPGAGTHTVQVRGTDAEGNTGPVATVTVFGDADDPSVEFVTLSAGDEISGTLTIRVDASDAQAMGSVIVFMDSGTLTLTLPATYNPVTGYYEVTVDTTALTEGAWGIAAVAFDQAGRYNITTPFVITLDNTEPTLAINNPTEGKYVYGTYTIVATATDTGSGFDTGGLAFTIDGGAWTAMTAGGGGQYTYDLDTTALADGLHTLTVAAIDDAGNIAWRTLRFYVDNTRPQVAVVAPSSNDYIEGSYVFAVSALDNLGIGGVTAQIDGASMSMNVTLGYNAASGYYEWTADTTAWADGTYTIRPFARELSGRLFTATATVTFFVDNNAPTLTVVAPMDGEIILNATYDVTVQADDVSFGLMPGDVEWRVDANPWSTMQAGASGWVVSWFTTDYADGEHTLSFRATDDAGHVTTVSISVTVDNHDPVVSLNTPSANEYLEGVYTFSARASDSLGVRSVQMNFGFSAPSPLQSADATFNPSTGYWELTVDTATLPDGPATIVLVATDNSGRQTTSPTIDFAVDNNAPQLLLMSPLHGDIVLETSLEVRIEASDEGFSLGTGDVEYNLDGAGWLPMANLTGEPTTWGFDLDTTGLADGEHRLAFAVTDAAGHVTSAELTFVVDLNDPTAQIVAPVSGEFAMDVYRFRVAAADALGISEVTLAFTGISGLEDPTCTLNPTTGLWEFMIDTTTLDDAEATVTAVATDSSGRTSEVAGPVDFIIDNNAPLVVFVSPVEGDILTRGEHTITLSVLDAFFDVEFGMVSISIDGGSWVVMDKDDSGDFVYDWNTTALTDGEHNIRVRAEDQAGHMSEASINVIVDNHDPTLAIVAPTDGQFVTGTINFQVSTSDARGVSRVTLEWVEGESVRATVNTATNYYEHSLDTTTLVDGTYTLTARSLDTSGRTSEASVEFYVDNTEPELTFDGPLNGAILDGNVTVTASATDTFIDTLQFSVDGVGWVDMVDGGGSFDSSGFSDGTHTITVRAIDGSGKSVEASSEVIIDNTDPVLTVADFPDMDEHVAGAVPFAVFSEDAVGVVGVTVTIGDEAWPVYLNPITGFYEWTFPTTAFEDGEYSLTFTSTDAAGHVTTIEWDVFVDNTAPQVLEMSPKEGATVQGIVHFEVTVDDATGVAEVLLRIGKHGSWTAMTLQDDGSYLYKWETTTEDDQEGLEYAVRVTDTLGNTDETSSKIDVNNPMNWVFLVIIVILVIIIVIGWLYMRQQEGGETEEDLAESDELEDITADLDALAGLGVSAEARPTENGVMEPVPTSEELASEVEVELEEKTLPE